MTTTLSQIRILSDGRPGHENQSMGLAEALQRRSGAQIECVRLDVTRGVLARIRQAKAGVGGGEAGPGGSPQLVIAAGHRTHLPLLVAARHFRARSVVIMKPSLPAWLFDACLVPRHDLKGNANRRRILPTLGALNRLPELPQPKTATGTILIGGPSKHHAWDGRPLLAAIARIVGSQPGLIWTVADSRRTPEGFLTEVESLRLPVVIVPHQQTGSGWLPARLMASQEVWVTEDSVSMVFEAITARARVGLLPLPAKRGDSRLIRAVDEAVAASYATRYADWIQAGGGKSLADASAVLHEAGRCADWILKRFFDHGVHGLPRMDQKR